MNEEQVIKRLERYATQRRLRVVIYVASSLAFLGIGMWALWCKESIDEIATSERISTMASFRNLKAELPVLFSRFYEMATASAKLMDIGRLLLAGAGVLIGVLILELAGFRKNELTLSMWRKIQALEKEVKELKYNLQEDL
jgi:biopolymer transport protein ExbB/TolQ